MFALNHTVTGVLIVAVVPNPVVALPIAFLAHFMLDALPHYADNRSNKTLFNHLKFILPIDMLLAFCVLVALAVVQPTHWQLMIAGGVLCASPDLMWFPKFLRSLRGDNKPRRGGIIMRFHKSIQWAERPWGFYVEALWFAVIGFVILEKLAA